MRRKGRLAEGVAMVLLAVAMASSSEAAPAHCQGYEANEITAMEPALRIQWLTDELAQCGKTAEGQAIAYTNRGVAYHDLGQIQQAMADYHQAIALYPEYRDAYYNRGNAYFELGQIQQAIDDYSQVIDLDPLLVQAYNNRGVAYCLATPKRVDAALADWMTAVELEPERARRYHKRLRDSGHYSGPIDGEFGPESQAAFRAWCEEV